MGNIQARGYGKAWIIWEAETGIPHVIADDNKTAMFALGYLHGGDWLWQMNYLRAFSQGKMSEIFGEATIEIDKALRNINI